MMRTRKAAELRLAIEMVLAYEEVRSIADAECAMSLDWYVIAEDFRQRALSVKYGKQVLQRRKGR